MVCFLILQYCHLPFLFFPNYKPFFKQSKLPTAKYLEETVKLLSKYISSLVSDNFKDNNFVSPEIRF